MGNIILPQSSVLARAFMTAMGAVPLKRAHKLKASIAVARGEEKQDPVIGECRGGSIENTIESRSCYCNTRSEGEAVATSQASNGIKKRLVGTILVCSLAYLHTVWITSVIIYSIFQTFHSEQMCDHTLRLM